MEIYDKNVQEHLKISPEICSLADAHAVHTRMIELRTCLKLDEGEFYPHYRSEQCYGWDLMPGLFRGPGIRFTSQEGKDLERNAISEYESRISAKIGNQTFRNLFNHDPNGKNWDLLFQAQHCGLRTSLIDWGISIVSSIFFGVEASTNLTIEATDGQLWVFMVPYAQLLVSDDKTEGVSYLKHDPFALTSGFMTNVPIYLADLEQRVCKQRISRQGGRFYVSPNNICNIPMNKQSNLAPLLFRWKIPAQFKPVIRKELEAVGISHANIYVKESPDHDKIAKELNKKIYGF